jgi:hypothetical protein
MALRRREITVAEVRRVLGAPEQRAPGLGRRVVYQSRARNGRQQQLLRVLVDLGPVPPVVVTAYRTSRVARHWRRA